MKKILSILTVLVMLQAQNVLAHAGGHGPISTGVAQMIALDAVEQFSQFDSGLGFGMLKPSWKGLSPETVKIASKGEGYYVVSVENKVEGKTLYLLISTMGDIYDANFSGSFPKVK